MDTLLKCLTVLLFPSALAGCISGPGILAEQQAAQPERLSPKKNAELSARYSATALTMYAKASEHLRRAERYGPPTDYARIENDFRRHCNYVAALYLEAANRYQELSRIHERSIYATDRENEGQAMQPPEAAR